MKLNNNSSIRVLIRKQGSKAAHITLSETTIAEAVEYIKRVLKPHADPFAEGRVTSVTVSKYTGKGADPQGQVTFSFKGMEPAETRLILCEAVVSNKEECIQTT